MSVTAQNVRDFLEGYCIDQTQLSNTWIDSRLKGFIIPYVERVTRLSISGVKSYVELYSGNGKSILILNRKPIISIQDIRYIVGGINFPSFPLSSIEVVQNEGVLKAKQNWEASYTLPLFAKGDYNIRVTYTAGFDIIPDDLNEAVLYLTAEQALVFIGARTGGGSISTQGYSRNYGSRGMFQDIRNDLARQAHFILNNYATGIVG